MENELLVLNTEEVDESQSLNYDELEELLEQQFEMEFSNLESLQTEFKEIGSPDKLSEVILDEIWNQFGNQIGLDMTSDTLLKQYNDKHPNGYTKEEGAKIMKDKRYTNANNAMKEKQKSGNLKDEYTGKTLKINDKANLDHVIPRKQIFENTWRKIADIETHMRAILHTLGMDLTDDSLKGTPKRVAKMFVKEIFGGLLPERKPSMSTFDNSYHYGEMLVEKNIVVYSTCEHHLLPIVGRAHVGYISNGKVLGLSKMNRIVEYYAKRPQVQERLTLQIVQEMQRALGTEDVACIIDAKHLCVNSRGIEDIDSSTVTAEFGGKFKDPEIRKEFLEYIKLETRFH